MNAVAEVAALIASEQLEAIRTYIAAMSEQVNRLTSEQRRCEAEAAKHRAVINALPAAQAALASLHEARTSGRVVTDDAIHTAEGELAQAQSRATRAELAERGALAAAAKFATQVAPIQQRIAAERAAARPVVRTILHQRVAEAVACHRVTMEEFVRAHIAHHAECNAVSTILQELGFAFGDGDFIANRGAGLIELRTTWTSTHQQADDVFDVSKEIASEAHRIAFELRALIL
jgi:hypothetical protein